MPHFPAVYVTSIIPRIDSTADGFPRVNVRSFPFETSAGKDVAQLTNRAENYT